MQATISPKLAEINFNEIRSVMILGRKWFDRVNGNTYHSATVYVDGIEVLQTAREYGYGDQYVETALEALEEHAPGWPVRRKYESGVFSESSRDLAERVGFVLTSVAVTVPRKRDL